MWVTPLSGLWSHNSIRNLDATNRPWLTSYFQSQTFLYLDKRKGIQFKVHHSLSLSVYVSLSGGLGEPLQFPPMKLVSLFVIQASAVLAVSPTWQLRTAGCLQLLSRPSQTCWLKECKHTLLYGRRRGNWLMQMMAEGSTGERRCSSSIPDLSCFDGIPDFICSRSIPDLSCSFQIPD